MLSTPWSRDMGLRVPILNAPMGGVAGGRPAAAVTAAGETDTTTTRVFDVGRGRPWPGRFPSRVLRNDFVARWDGCEDALADDTEARDELAGAIAAEDYRVAPVDAGQGVGTITGVTSLGDVVERLCSGAQRLLEAW